MTIILDPGNKKKLDYLYAAISVDPNGEGIVASFEPGIGFKPMVTGDKERIDEAMDEIKMLSRECGKKIIIVKYQKIEILETIDMRQ